jgi:hypothetical protein
VVLIEPPNEAGLERRMYHCVLDECSGIVVVMFPRRRCPVHSWAVFIIAPLAQLTPRRI